MLAKNYTPRISFVSGIVNAGDALSETILAELEAIDRIAVAERRNIDARVYCAASSVPDSRIIPVQDWRQLLGEEHFLSSECYFYHFGIFSPMHQSLAFTRRDAYVSACFHNVTQPQYLPRSAEALIHQSYQQIELLRVADEHFAASHYSAEQLRHYGLGRPVSVVPLFGPNGASVQSREHRPFTGQEPVTLLYCGRFVPSKGVRELLEALNQRDGTLQAPLTLTLAGIEEHSDPAYLSQLRAMADQFQGQVRVRFQFNLSSDALQALYASSDGFILPSYHEGFGMPVVEAYLHAVPVLCSNSGALPEVSGGLGLTFAAGRPEAIGQAIDRFVNAHVQGKVATDAGDVDKAQWLAEVARYAALFEREAFVERAVVRLRERLDRVGYRSDSYRSELSAVVRSAVPRDEDVPPVSDEAAAFAEVSDRLEAALRGAMIGNAVKTQGETGAPAMMRAFLEWPFNNHQSDEDIQHWLSQMKGGGLRGLAEHFGNTADVRNSPGRMAASPYVKGAVMEADAPTPSNPSLSGATWTERMTIDHPVMILLLESPVSTPEFIKQLFRMALQREHEDNGYGPYHDAIEAGALSRVEIAMEVLSSAEHLALEAAG
jgi:glycosyltransferase involved in cell wall biosynthesis